MFVGEEEQVKMENSFGPVIFYETSFGLKITETLVVSWIIIGVLILSSYLLTRNLKKVPTGVQNIPEMLVGGVYSLVKSTMGAEHIYFAPYIGTLMLYLAAANLCGLTGFMRPPTADLNTTFGLALITFFMCHIKGIQSKGIKSYLKGFTEPFFLLTPINLIGEIANPISLSFRLFGNLVGGLIIMSLVYGALSSLSSMLFGWNVPILQLGFPVLLHMYFDVFSGLLQTFIFGMLTMVYISSSME